MTGSVGDVTVLTIQSNNTLEVILKLKNKFEHLPPKTVKVLTTLVEGEVLTLEYRYLLYTTAAFPNLLLSSPHHDFQIQHDCTRNQTNDLGSNWSGLCWPRPHELEIILSLGCCWFFVRRYTRFQFVYRQLYRQLYHYTVVLWCHCVIVVVVVVFIVVSWGLTQLIGNWLDGRRTLYSYLQETHQTTIIFQEPKILVLCKNELEVNHFFGREILRKQVSELESHVNSCSTRHPMKILFGGWREYITTTGSNITQKRIPTTMRR